MKKYFILFVFLLCMAGSAWAQALPAILADVNPKSGTVGDVFTYSSTITWPEEIYVIPPEPSDEMGECRVLDRNVSDLVVENGINKLNVTLKIACYKTGEQKLPPLEVTFTDENGDQRTEQGPEVTLNIMRLLPEDAKDVKDIKGQQSLPPDYITPLAIAAGALFAALIFYLLLRKLGKRRKKAEKQKIEVPEPYPYAVSRFESGKLDKLLSDGDIDGFYVELTDILREYLEGRFRVEALEMTTTEIAQSLRNLQIDGFLKTDLRGILDRADMAKFARIYPDTDECKEDMAKGREFVEKTRPVVATAEADEKKEGAA